jgi:hypothetical protein
MKNLSELKILHSFIAQLGHSFLCEEKGYLYCFPPYPAH